MEMARATGSVLAIWLLVLAACAGDTSVTTSASPDLASTAPSAGTVTSESSAFDRPLPAVEQLDGASDCDTLNMLMVGVHAEGLRFTADVTNEEYNDVGTYDDEATALLAAHFGAFSATSVRLECSDSESAAVFDSWFEEWCRVWFADGHDADEDPLLFNTGLCIGGGSE